MQGKNTCYLIAVLIAVMAVGVVAPCFAQDAGSDPLITLEFKDTDVRTAIETLFRGSGKNFSIDSDVTGMIAGLKITAKFDDALRALLRAGGLVKRIDNGTYVISKKQATTDPNILVGTPSDAVATTAVDTTTVKETKIDKIKLYHTGASELLNMVNGSGTSGSTMGSFGNNSMGSFGSSSMGSSFGSSSFGGSSSNRSFGSSSFGSSGSSYSRY